MEKCKANIDESAGGIKKIKKIKNYSVSVSPIYRKRVKPATKRRISYFNSTLTIFPAFI